MPDPTADQSSLLTLSETLAAGPLGVGPTPPRPGLTGAFERMASAYSSTPSFPGSAGGLPSACLSC